MFDYSAFKSGTDIRGFALEDDGNPLYMSDEFIRKSTYGFLAFLSSKGLKDGLKISVGHDSRLSAERIKENVIAVLVSFGVQVIDCGLASTPAMFMTTVELDCDAAVQITASHHPKDRNGLKFFTRSGGLDSCDIEYILKSASSCDNPLSDKTGSVTQVDFMDRYSGLLREMIIKGSNAGDKPLSGKKIVVDAGNGVGGFYAEKVLAPLGADVSGSIFLNPDGNFPNHAPNPENKEAMGFISDAVIKNNADFGIIFDTDVDRAACVGKDGLEINRNRLVALASAVALKNCEGGYIVTDSVTSDGLAAFIKSHGGKHIRFKRGYRNVINKQIELENEGEKCPLAMETSGHAAFSENYYLDDGAYLITRLLVEMASLSAENMDLEDIISSLEEAQEENELRFTIKLKDFRPVGNEVIDYFKSAEKQGWVKDEVNYEGIRINCDKDNGDGWFLLRLSVHDPIIVLNMESNSAGGVKKMAADILECLSKLTIAADLDICSLTDFVS